MMLVLCLGRELDVSSSSEVSAILISRVSRKPKPGESSRSPLEW